MGGVGGQPTVEDIRPRRTSSCRFAHVFRCPKSQPASTGGNSLPLMGVVGMARLNGWASVKKLLVTGALLLALSAPAVADVTPLPASFHTQDIATDGATIHVRVGGT